MEKSYANVPIEQNGIFTLQFAGEEWIVKNKLIAKAGPGPNFFDQQNVWVDKDGQLHLILKKRADNTWSCAEIFSKRLYGDGIYQFWLDGRPDLFDENVVLGFFNYPCTLNDCETDGTHEIDIEFTKWGNINNANNLHYNTYPTVLGGTSYSKSFPMALKNNYSTHRIIRQSSNVRFQSLYQYQNTSEQIFASAVFGNQNSTLNMPIHINLWLFLGKSPQNGKDIEIIIKDFKFTAR